MRIHELSSLLLAAALCGLAPVSLAGGDDTSLTTDRKKEIAVTLELALHREPPALSAFDGECKAYACKDGCTEQCKAETAKYVAKVQADPTAYYGEMFAKEPESWKVLAPLIETRFAGEKTTSEQRGIMLDLVAYAPYETSAELSAELWRDNRAAFTEEHVLVFASRGGECFTEELRTRVASGACADIRPAALLAFRGDATGKKSLVTAIKTANLRKDASDALLAALALEGLGKEGVFDRVRTEVGDEALAALDEGDLDRARRLALQAQFFTELAAKGEGKWAKKLDLARLEQKIGYHCESRCGELASAESIFALIETVTPM